MLEADRGEALSELSFNSEEAWLGNAHGTTRCYEERDGLINQNYYSFWSSETELLL